MLGRFAAPAAVRREGRHRPLTSLLIHIAITPRSWRQKPTSYTVIAKRHKTVRTFLTNFEKIFLILAQNYLTPFSPFIYRDGTRQCHQYESIYA